MRRASFARLQRRIHRVSPPAAVITETPVDYVVFDILEHDGRSVMSQPYTARRALLESLELPLDGLQLVPSWPGVDADRVLQQVAAFSLEGIVSKRCDAIYRPGRSRAWIKTVIRRSVSALVLGWLPGSGPNAGTFGALVLGARGRDGGIRFVGCVGSGFSNAARRVLRDTFDTLVVDAAPDDAFPAQLPGARWIAPVLVAEVNYREFGLDGMLRHASFRGIRADIDAESPTDLH
ncbi:ATP dependent DNA ligase [Nocardia asteroides]